MCDKRSLMIRRAVLQPVKGLDEKNEEKDEEKEWKKYSHYLMYLGEQEKFKKKYGYYRDEL